MTKQLVVLDASEYGLEEVKAKQISDMFKPMLDEMVSLESSYNEVLAAGITPENCNKAHELRQKYVKVRTGTAKIHKELKAFYISGGKFVDGWKNAQLMASQGNEEKLMAIEKHFENIEKERIANLHAARVAELNKYSAKFIPETLGELEAGVWENYLGGVAAAYKLKQEEEECVRKEGEIRIEAARLKAEEEAKITAAAEAKRQKEHAEAETKLKEETKKREQAEADLKAIADAQVKAKQAQEDRLEAEANKGDEDKVKDLIRDLKLLGEKYTFKSAKNKKMYADVKGLLQKVADFAVK